MKQGENKFHADPLFAAANSGKGFVSFYTEVFADPSIEQRYIIKGGPGTGKSSFMKKTAKAAEAQGRDIEYYRCSSDPDSLDGIVIDGRIAVLDGTAPHSVDTTLAGARDEIVDLGAFWDPAALRVKRSVIEELAEKKSEAYRRAYRFLAACDELFCVGRSLVLPCFKHEKLERAVRRILSEIPSGSGARVLPALIDSVGMKGRVRFDSYERSAKRLYVIEDHYQTGHLFLRALITGALDKECELRVSYDPIHIEEPNAVYFCHTGDCFVISDGKDSGTADVKVNMKRFVSADKIREIRSEWRNNKHLYDAMIASACDCLKKAGEYHFELEKIYVSAMDFKAENEFCERFIARVLGNIN